VAGQANLYLGSSKLRLCADCVNAFQTQAGTPSRLKDLIDWYETKRGTSSEITRLRKRVTELEDLLDELTAPSA
jgi:hypothetical protein